MARGCLVSPSFTFLPSRPTPIRCLPSSTATSIPDMIDSLCRERPLALSWTRTLSGETPRGGFGLVRVSPAGEGYNLSIRYSPTLCFAVRDCLGHLDLAVIYTDLLLIRFLPTRPRPKQTGREAWTRHGQSVHVCEATVLLAVDWEGHTVPAKSSSSKSLIPKPGRKAYTMPAVLVAPHL